MIVTKFFHTNLLLECNRFKVTIDYHKVYFSALDLNQAEHLMALLDTVHALTCSSINQLSCQIAIASNVHLQLVKCKEKKKNWPYVM